MVRPTMRVFVRRFGGWAMTADSWSQQRQQLENDLQGKPHHDREYYTNGYNSPWDTTNRYKCKQGQTTDIVKGYNIIFTEIFGPKYCNSKRG